MQILITGANGQLGHELVRATVDAGHEVVATSHETLDITDKLAVDAAITAAQPDVVIHAAAWTAVDACESDPDKAMLVNGTATKYIADAAHAVGAHVVYISTDYVFDGSKTSAYDEGDTPNPQSVYGASKLAGERALGPNDAIVRIAWVCGFYGGNMVKTILRLAEQPQLKFVDDQIGNPTFADNAAEMIVRLAAEKRPGTWHVTNQGDVSWYEFAREVLMAAGLDAGKVAPIKTRELQPPRPAQRPANSVLNNGSLKRAGIELLPDFRVPLARLVSQIQRNERG
ncbi:MAG: dTDP-4-dehydrorhamnose reductase [Actinobacteria bacterium]|nr:dTDP-4-dehydrorhamnose reductase [Actinomycetota bacterium]